MLGTGRSSRAFLGRLDEKFLEKNGGRVELVVVSPEDVQERVSPSEDVTEIVRALGGHYLKAKAKDMDLFERMVKIDNPSTGGELCVSYDSLVLGIGTKTDVVTGTERRAFRLPKDEAALKKHLRTCQYFYDISGDAKYLQIAVVVPRSGMSDLACELSKISEFLDREFSDSNFVVSEGITDAVRVHESFVVERRTHKGGRRFNRFGTIVTSDVERTRTPFAANIVSQIPLADAGYHTECGILVDGFHRVVGAGGGVFAIGSAAYERSGVSRVGALSDEVSKEQGAYLADLVNNGILVI